MRLSKPSKLVAYGIQTDQSDLRVHVCVQSKRAYIFPTRAGKAAIDPQKHRKVSATQPGVEQITAFGFLVPPDDIPGCTWVSIPDEWLNHSRLKIERKQSTSVKGDRASLIVTGLVKTGRLPILKNAAKVQAMGEHQLQVSGVDLRVTIDIQVKCDMCGGHREAGGTGNLFLQTQECNPLKLFGETAKDRRPAALQVSAIVTGK